MKYQSDILEAIRESAAEKFQIGAISEARMHEYDEMCLVPETSHDDTANETAITEQAALVTV